MTSIGFTNFFIALLCSCCCKNHKSNSEESFGVVRRPDLSGHRTPSSKTYVSKKIIPAIQKQASRSSIGYYISNLARNISIIWLPYAKKVMASRVVRVDELSPFSWKDVKNSEIDPSFEDCTTTFEHGDRPAIDQLVEDVMEN
ncbi:hypothetical protein GcM1_198043 [Golovinomyces cichoracearum]|uniref:Uncharacterized protein n=1 Tax=Golovinomyces cichoracearum TaxID=62708 RepID=A0A420IZJ3_9PEZI|nr:hypothetical protein GcM1_198043 [Golovinomyces cichoracearum]